MQMARKLDESKCSLDKADDRFNRCPFRKTIGQERLCQLKRWNGIVFGTTSKQLPCLEEAMLEDDKTSSQSLKVAKENR